MLEHGDFITPATPTRLSANRSSSKAQRANRTFSLAAIAAVALMLVGAAGCANAALSSARKEIATGNYAQARQHLVEAKA
ncbi:MAG: hypothetical protein ACREH9_14430, partial [Pseudomonadota bacterium]